MVARLMERFHSGRRESVVTLGYTPAALRSGFAEREGAERSTGRSMGPTMTTTDATTAAARQIRRIGKGSATSATWKFDCGLWSTVPQWRMHSLSARVLCPLRAVLEGGDSLAESEQVNGCDSNHDTSPLQIISSIRRKCNN
mmetsp:Transcript_5985/g.13103  ORF Transcript_5985/g.13103 Transcript_5985/m.13103 type:complete len:142 (+) Transcript_5985:573-998(+)